MPRLKALVLKAWVFKTGRKRAEFAFFGLVAGMMAVGLLASSAAFAQQRKPEKILPDKLGTLEKAMQESAAQGQALKLKAETLAVDLDALRLEQVRTAKGVQDHEDTIRALQERLKRLGEAEARETEELARRHGHLEEVLAGLERFARRPPESLAALHVPPAEAVRGGILMRAAVPPMDAEARQLRDELARLADLRAIMAVENRKLAAADAALLAERQRLNKLVERKARLRSQAEAQSALAAQRTAALAIEAKDLKELLAHLEARKKAGEPVDLPKALTKAGPSGLPPGVARPIRLAYGSLPFPARGDVVARFGEDTENGNGKGITIATLAGAQVVAPYDGQVVFSGPFRGYGQLLIIDHGEGYHSLLAGLTRVDSAVGQWLLAGEPVGIMAPSGDSRPNLYVELRQNGRPINPLPWMAARTGKVSG